MNITLDQKFFFGGKSTFTVDNGKGEHYTFKIKLSRDGKLFFGSYLTGPDNETSYTYLGVVCALTGGVRLTKASKLTEDSKPVKVLAWALRKVLGDKILPEGYQIRHSGRCGCCNRVLTHPQSLTTGIGPECAKRMGLCP